MYSGTLIEDLLAVVERAERFAQLTAARGDVEVGLFSLHAGLQVSQQNQAEEFFAGAA
jgi:hypothetical protein